MEQPYVGEEGKDHGLFSNNSHAPVERQSAPRLITDLPSELQTAIISWIFRPTHLAAVCLSCKQLREIAMPFLYNVISLNETWDKSLLERFLVYGHPGHQHIRTLDIDCDEIESEKKILAIAKSALAVLPRNCLKSFRCPLEDGIDNDLMILLASQQRKLTFLGIGPLERHALNISTALLPWPPIIETLVIPWKIHRSTDIEFYQKLIERSANKLKALTIRTELYRGPWEDKMYFEDTATSYLTRGLFKHYLLEQNHPAAAQLNDLNFQNQDFRTCAPLWLKVVNFSTLRTLQIWNCDDIDALLVELMLVSKTLVQLMGLVLSFESTSQAPKLAQMFIACVKNLEYLNLCYSPEKPGYAQIDVGCLRNHCKTMKDLYIGVGANNKPSLPLVIIEMDDIEWISENFLKLRQLAIGLPPITIDDALSGRWGDFGRALEMLATLPRLKILRILTWPLVSWSFAPSWQNGLRRTLQRRFLAKLDIIATSIAHIFSRVRAQYTNHDRLSVLMFGSAEHRDFISNVDGSQDRPERAPFVYKIRRKQTEFGFVTKAKRIEAKFMKYEEPIAYVVDEDTDQGLSLEAYPWGGSIYP